MVKFKAIKVLSGLLQSERKHPSRTPAQICSTQPKETSCLPLPRPRHRLQCSLRLWPSLNRCISQAERFQVSNYVVREGWRGERSSRKRLTPTATEVKLYGQLPEKRHACQQNPHFLFICRPKCSQIWNIENQAKVPKIQKHHLALTLG